MAVTVKKAILWRKELKNRAGTLAESLKPFADASANLQVVMGYVFPGDHNRAALEVYPVSGAKAEKAASAAGMSAFPEITCLIVQGEDRVGLGYEIANAIGKAAINVNFACIQVIAGRYTGIFGFHSEKDADKATQLIKTIKAPVAARKKATGKSNKTSARKVSKRPGKSKAAKAPVKHGKKSVSRKSASKMASPRSGAKKPAAKKSLRK